MIRLLFALAVAAFVLSLPVAKTNLGARLRQIAGVAFLLALLPSIIWGLFFPSSTTPATAPIPTPTPPTSSWEQLVSGLSCFGLLVLVSLVAYGVLAIRKTFRKPTKEPWEILFSRGGGKRRVESPAEDDEFFGGLR
jgi:hypothetical protein